MAKSKLSPKRLVYFFGDGKADGDASQKELLGGKGANLAEMCRLGMPVPAGFTITTEVCRAYFEEGQRYPARLWKDVRAALARIERSTGKSFGSGPNPLLVSVRSGARVSMPGMMDTVLNLGLNEKTVEALAERSGNPRFAWDVYRRFVQMYADVVLGLKAESETDDDPFTAARESLKRKRRLKEDHELDRADLVKLVATYKRIVREKTGKPFPEDPWQQLQRAIGSVFESWNSARAIAYRTMNHIPSDWGTACNVVAMVFGNLGTDSGTGVAFTRDPATGERRFYGEYLTNAQGEDVVAGLRTPEPMEVLAKIQPRAWKELNAIRDRLERHYKDMQDLEFTIEHGRLYMLQCRSGKRTGMAAVRIAVDMVREGLIDQRTAVLRVPPTALDQLLQPVFAQKELDKARKERRRLGKGLAAGPGAATGRIAFTATSAQERRARGESVVLVRIETSPEDILGMQASAGILTARGGMTSHAALVARQMGKVCVVGAGELEIDYKAGTLRCGGTQLSAGRLALDRRLDRRDLRRGDRDAALRGRALGLRQEARQAPQGLARLRLRAAAGLGRRLPAPARARQRRPARPVRPRDRLRRRGRRPVPHRAHVLRGREDRRGARDDRLARPSCSASRRWRASCRCSARTSRASSPRWARAR